jgi:branched-chain amino acid transport system permease protein
MTTFLQIVVSGLLIGCVYGLIGIGFSMSYLTAGILNFAQGDIVGIGAYLVLEFYLMGLPLVLATVITAVIVGLAIGLVNHFIWRPLYRYGMVYPTLCSFGVAIVIESFIQEAWGASPRILKPILSMNTHDFGGVRISDEQLLGAGLSIVLCLAVAWMLAATRSGRAMRLLARDPDVASLVGVRRNRLLFLSFAVGGVLSVVAAIIIGPVQGLSPEMGVNLTVLGFTAAALGGFGSAAGALIGGIVVGVGENLIVVYLNPNFRDAITYGLLIFVLLLRPQGLLGEKQARARVV